MNTTKIIIKNIIWYLIVIGGITCLDYLYFNEYNFKSNLILYFIFLLIAIVHSIYRIKKDK